LNKNIISGHEREKEVFFGGERGERKEQPRRQGWGQLRGDGSRPSLRNVKEKGPRKKSPRIYVGIFTLQKKRAAKKVDRRLDEKRG